MRWPKRLDPQQHRGENEGRQHLSSSGMQGPTLSEELTTTKEGRQPEAGNMREVAGKGEICVGRCAIPTLPAGLGTKSTEAHNLGTLTSSAGKISNRGDWAWLWAALSEPARRKVRSTYLLTGCRSSLEAFESHFQSGLEAFTLATRSLLVTSWLCTRALPLPT